jgi:hypothetical protein
MYLCVSCTSLSIFSFLDEFRITSVSTRIVLTFLCFWSKRLRRDELTIISIFYKYFFQIRTSLKSFPKMLNSSKAS